MTTSAPGKLLLFGDHAVVYGYPGIVTAVSERLFVTPGGDTSQTDTRFIDAAVAAWGKEGMRFSARSVFSGKYGLGSSSAVTVATLKAIRPDADAKEIFDTAYKIVLDIQKVGSGFDVAAAAYGGTLYYRKGKPVEQFRIPAMPLIVGYTGVKSSTVDIVREVAQKREQNLEKVERIFRAVENIVDEAKQKIAEGDWERTGRLMDFNQEYLRDLGVSSEKLEALIRGAKLSGAWGAKLSGAGGGDCMIALAPPQKRTAVEAAIVAAGGEIVRVTPDAPGVRLETTDNQDELFVVVDRDDRIVGYKTRYECHHDPSLIHRTVGALIFNTEGRVLLQKRSRTKDMEAGLWGISAAGHVTKGQTDEEAVHRELTEELGVDTPLSFIKKFITSNGEETERAAVYKGFHNGPFTPDTNEVDVVQFFDPREIVLRVASKQLLLTRAAADTLREAGIL